MGERAAVDWGVPAARAGVWNPWRGRQPLGKGGGNLREAGVKESWGGRVGGSLRGARAEQIPFSQMQGPLRSLFQLESPPHAVKGQPRR